MVSFIRGKGRLVGRTRGHKRLWNVPCCVGGDFYLIRFWVERKNHIGPLLSMRHSSKIIE